MRMFRKRQDRYGPRASWLRNIQSLPRVSWGHLTRHGTNGNLSFSLPVHQLLQSSTTQLFLVVLRPDHLLFEEKDRRADDAFARHWRKDDVLLEKYKTIVDMPITCATKTTAGAYLYPVAQLSFL